MRAIFRNHASYFPNNAWICRKYSWIMHAYPLHRQPSYPNHAGMCQLSSPMMHRCILIMYDFVNNVSSDHDLTAVFLSHGPAILITPKKWHPSPRIMHIECGLIMPDFSNHVSILIVPDHDSHPIPIHASVLIKSAWPWQPLSHIKHLSWNCYFHKKRFKNLNHQCISCEHKNQSSILW